MFVVCLGSVLEDSLFSVFRGFWDSYSVQERKYGDQGDEGAPSCRENREVKRNREKKKKKGILNRNSGRRELERQYLKRSSLKENFPGSPVLKNPPANAGIQFSLSVVSDFLSPHGLQHARLLCPSPTPRACSSSGPSGW